MKLFKKLAAAALAAVLALSMVGCGKANSVNSTKQFVLDLMADYATLGETELSNTAEMDGIAQKLLNKAAELYGTEGHAGEPVGELLKAASKESVLTKDKIHGIMSARSPSVKPREPQLTIAVSKVERYFPKGCTSEQMESTILKLLENYYRKRQDYER